MITDSKIRQGLFDVLPKNYRKVIAQRLKKKYKLTPHPNTITNVMSGATENEVIEDEIFLLAEEIKQRKQRREERAREFVKQSR